MASKKHGSENRPRAMRQCVDGHSNLEGGWRNKEAGIGKCIQQELAAIARASTPRRDDQLAVFTTKQSLFIKVSGVGFSAACLTTYMRRLYDILGPTVASC